MLNDEGVIFPFGVRRWWSESSDSTSHIHIQISIICGPDGGGWAADGREGDSEEQGEENKSNKRQDAEANEGQDGKDNLKNEEGASICLDGQWDRTNPESDTAVQVFQGSKLHGLGISQSAVNSGQVAVTEGTTVRQTKGS